ncbi:hypothetical protein Tco_0022402 [Tanacetum coccineum]
MIIRAETVKDHQDYGGECWAILMGYGLTGTGQYVGPVMLNKRVDIVHVFLCGVSLGLKGLIPSCSIRARGVHTWCVARKKERNAFYVLRQRKTKASSKSFLSQWVTTRTQQQGMFESRKLARRRVKEGNKIARESNKKDSKRMQQER